LKVESWKLKVESWKLKIESWKLKVESWKLKVESWKLKVESWGQCWDHYFCQKIKKWRVSWKAIVMSALITALRVKTVTLNPGKPGLMRLRLRSKYLDTYIHVCKCMYIHHGNSTDHCRNQHLCCQRVRQINPFSILSATKGTQVKASRLSEVFSVNIQTCVHWIFCRQKLALQQCDQMSLWHKRPKCSPTHFCQN
jgi:hypothetical protein